MSLLTKLGLADEAPEAPPAKPAKPQPAFPAQPIYPTATAAFTAPEASTGGDDVYQQLLTATDFNTTDVGQTINRFKAPLDALPLSDEQKFKSALAQAKANGGLTDDLIRTSFTSLHNELEKAKTDFNTQATQYTQEKIDKRAQRITEINTQIADLQKEQAELQTKLAQSQGKSAARSAQFAAAVQRRGEELDHLEQQYEALLKG